MVSACIKRRYFMTEGLILSKTMPNDKKAEIWCASHTPENAFMQETDVAIVELRFPADRFAENEKIIRRRFYKIFSNLDFNTLKATKEVDFEFSCPLMDGDLWNVVIAHCRTAQVTDYIISTFVEALDSL